MVSKSPVARKERNSILSARPACQLWKHDSQMESCFVLRREQFLRVGACGQLGSGGIEKPCFDALRCIGDTCQVVFENGCPGKLEFAFGFSTGTL